MEITYRRIGEILGKSEFETQKIFLQEGVGLYNCYGLVQIFQKYIVSKKTGKHIDYQRARYLLDEVLLKDFFDEFKRLHPTCEQCGTLSDLHVHHINYNHFDNRKRNLSRLCNHCHFSLHHVARLKSINEKVILIPFALASRYTKQSAIFLRSLIDQKKISVVGFLGNKITLIYNEIISYCIE